MDNLTHSLVGVMLSRAGLDRFTPQATTLCVIAANAPDVDIIVGLDPEVYLVYHRHLTHSLLTVPAMAAVAVGLTVLWVWLRNKTRGEPVAPLRRRSVGRMWAVALIPALSHPLLDLTNAYGVRLWLPFSPRWSSWDALFIIDLVVWALLLAGAGAPWILRNRGVRLYAAAAALVALTLYIAAGAAMRRHIVGELSQRTFDGARPLEVAAFPMPPGPLDWSAYVRTDEFDLWLPIDFAGLDAVAPDDGRKFTPPVAAEEIEAAWETGLGRAYRQFAQYPLEMVSRSPDGREVVLSDFRFMRYGQPGFQCVVQFDQALRVVSAQFEF